MTRNKPRPPLTPEQLAAEDLLCRLAALQAGEEIALDDRAHDGFGRLIVKRHNKHTYIFQRENFRDRSRWADDPDEMREEIECYLATGRLRDPDKVKGW